MILRIAASTFILVILISFLNSSVESIQICPVSPSDTELTCSVLCCKKFEDPNSEYFCCGDKDSTIFYKSAINDLNDKDAREMQKMRAKRFVSYQTGLIQVDYTLMVIGFIISVVLSILFSLLCCLLCNGCWLHRRRNPHMYETVNDSGFYPICCGFGIPLGTVVFSTHPPQFNNDNSIYNGGSNSNVSYPSSRNRVRFNEDGTPKGVLKNGNDQFHPHQDRYL